jgi:shikimate kinase
MVSGEGGDDGDDSSGRHIVVVGLMGAGKTTVGRLLAQQLGMRFVDNDEQLRAAVGATAADYQQRHGRAALHRAELDAFRDALDATLVSVIAAAASVVDSAEGRALLARTNVAWIDASAEVRDGRRASDPDRHRPPDPRPEDEQRRRELGEIADATVDGDATPDRIAASLTAWASARLQQ